MVFIEAGEPLYTLGQKRFPLMQGVNVEIVINTRKKLITYRPSSFIKNIKSVSIKTQKSGVIKSLIFSISGIKVTGGVSDPEVLKNTEKVVGDLKQLLPNDAPIIPTMIRKCFGASMLLVSESRGNILVTGLASSDIGDRVIASPTLIPLIINNESKIIERLCEEISTVGKHFRPDTVLRPLFSKSNPYMNTGPVFLSSTVTSPELANLEVSVRSGGVIRPIDALVGVEKAGVFDRPIELYVSFVRLGETIIPVFKSVGDNSVTFTPDTLKDRRHFAFVVGMRTYKRVISDKVVVFSERVSKDKGSEIVSFRVGDEIVKLTVSSVTEKGRRTKILWMKRYGDEIFEGVFDSRIIHLLPTRRKFSVGVMFSDDGKAFIPMFFTSGGIKGYLVDLENAVINRAVIDV